MLLINSNVISELRKHEYFGWESEKVSLWVCEEKTSTGQRTQRRDKKRKGKGQKKIINERKKKEKRTDKRENGIKDERK